MTDLRWDESLTQVALVGTGMGVAHRLSPVRDADTICVMKRGVLVEEGSHDELVAREKEMLRRGVCKGKTA